MKLFGWSGNKFKLLNISILKVKCKKDKLCFYLFGLPVFCKKDVFLDLVERVKQNKDFDTRHFDSEIAALAPEATSVSASVNNKRIAYLVTELYDTGGHSKCIREDVSILADVYDQCLFFTQKDRAVRGAPQCWSELKRKALIEGENLSAFLMRKRVKSLFKKIVRFNPKVLFVYIHPDDVGGTMVLSMLKKYTNIKLMYCPHASHFPNLGISFADITLEALPTTMYLTQKYRHFDNTVYLPMLSKKCEDFPVFLPECISLKRKEIGIKDGYLCTMSGASSYKFFDGNKSEYFEMIKTLLERNTNLIHVILADNKKNNKEVIDGIFANSNAKDRLILLPFTDDYELVFKCADVFVDSFPVSSALTMIDLMRLKVPYVVKINRENAHWSFHEYQSADYPYMFEKADDLLKGVEKLLSDKIERARIIEANFNHYMNTFEGNSVKKRLCDIIDNAENLERFYSGKIKGDYQFRGLGL